MYMVVWTNFDPDEINLSTFGCKGPYATKADARVAMRQQILEEFTMDGLVDEEELNEEDERHPALGLTDDQWHFFEYKAVSWVISVVEAKAP